MPACQACICPPWQPCLLSLELLGRSAALPRAFLLRLEGSSAKRVAA